ncbi:MAG: alpha/beta fold hydrolase [Pseudonocardiaceae bacterium]
MKVIFVHGACVIDSAWWWHRMAAPLADLGLSSHAVELPSCGSGAVDDLGDMYSDADAVRALLAGSAEPVILCGHSYGGMVITDAGADQANVAHLVYLSAVMPDRDQSHASFAGPEPPPWMDPRDDGTTGIRTEQPELLHALFLQDCDQETRDEATRRLTRQSLAAFAQPPRGVAWRTVPSTYVICTDDRATPPAVQRAWSKPATEVRELHTGHHPFLSQPDLLTQLIAEVARTTTQEP